MTEQEWLICTTPRQMLPFVNGKLSERKTRLFGCACCRLVWHLLPDRSRQLVEAVERFADKALTANDLNRVFHGYGSSLGVMGGSQAFNAVYCLWIWREEPRSSMKLPTEQVAKSVAVAMAKTISWKDARQLKVRLLHDFVGNPFRPYPIASWPTPIMQLADALYNGQDCGFALHDALLEADHAELAEHFRAEQWHPKGCWVLDVILGNQ